MISDQMIVMKRKIFDIVTVQSIVCEPLRTQGVNHCGNLWDKFQEISENLWESLGILGDL